MGWPNSAVDDASNLFKVPLSHILTYMQEEREAEDARIAGLKGTELVAAMQDGTLTSERAMEAFCRRAYTIGNVKTKGVTEEFYDEAVQAAKVLDDSRSTQHRSGGGGNAVGVAGTGGLLQGVPISVKDALHMKGAVSKHPYFFGGFCLRGTPPTPP